MILEGSPPTNKDVSLSELPPLAVDSMTLLQLQEFIPQLIRLATGRPQIFEKTQDKPEWWPDDTPWTNPDTEHLATGQHSSPEMMRKVVRSCYKHLGQENLLTAATMPASNSHKPQQSKALSLHNENNEIKQEVDQKECSDPDPMKSEAPATDDSESVWVCFICAKAFQQQEELMLHQDDCEKEFDERERLKIMISMAKPPSARFRHRPRSRLFSMTRSRIKRKPIPDIYIPPPPDVFFNSLGLLPMQKAEKIRMTPKKNDDDCQILGVENFTEPANVPTPRTPKSLMSQLSREGEASARKRQLSFSAPTADSDSDSSGSGNETVEREASKISKASIALFGIPLSSALGWRVRKSLKTDSSVPVISSYEKYCYTGAKNDFMDKLRNRPSDFPITFYKKKRLCARFVHQYKFCRADRIEFRKIVKTGLNKQGRRLLKQIRGCSVKLTRLAEDVIKEWTRPKRPVIQWRYIQPSSINPARNYMLLQRPQMRNLVPQMRQQIPRMRQFVPQLRQQSPQLRHLAPQPMFMYRNASGQLLTGMAPQQTRVQHYPHLSKNLLSPQRAVRPQNPYRPPILRQPESNIPTGPRPQNLLKSVITGPKSSSSSDEVIVINLDDESTSEPPSPQKSLRQLLEVRRADSPSSKRKQTFTNLREDDEISIISMSSSDEEGNVTQPKQGCCLNCDKKTGGVCTNSPVKSPVIASTSSGVGRGGTGGASRGGRIGPGGKPRKFRSVARAEAIKVQKHMQKFGEDDGATVQKIPQNRNGFVYSGGNIVPGTKVIASTENRSQLRPGESLKVNTMDQSKSPCLTPRNSAFPLQSINNSINQNTPNSSGSKSQISELAKQLTVSTGKSGPMSAVKPNHTPVGSTVFKQRVANEVVEVICIDDSDED